MSLEIIYSIVAIFGGFVALVWGADRFVNGASATASNFGVSPLIIGLTIVGLGTSAPEIFVSIVAAWQGNPSLAVGNAIGSNITNIGLVLGCTAMMMPLMVKSDILRREYPVMFVIMLLALMLIVDGHLGFWDGVILMVGLVFMIYWIVNLGLRKDKRDPMEKEFAKEIPQLSTKQGLFWLAIGLVILLISSRFLVWGAVNIAEALGVSDLIIGLTIVAIGTSLPELAASLISAYKKEPDIAIGNVIGSNMFNLLVVFGLPGLISPHTLDAAVLTRDFPFMIGLSIALFAVAYGFRGDGRITRIEGGLLLVTYFAYLGTLYWQTSH